MIITILELANEYAFPKLQVIGLTAVLGNIKIYRRNYVLFKITFIIWIRKGPIKMLGWPLRVPWPFVSGTPPHLKKE